MCRVCLFLGKIAYLTCSIHNVATFMLHFILPCDRIHYKMIERPYMQFYHAIYPADLSNPNMIFSDMSGKI